MSLPSVHQVRDASSQRACTLEVFAIKLRLLRVLLAQIDFAAGRDCRSGHKKAGIKTPNWDACRLRLSSVRALPVQAIDTGLV
jgi:hypothetical protein